MSDYPTRMQRNIALYPWHNMLHNLVFWQATWFLYFQNALSASEAILLYVAYDLAVTALEVPSGYMSDRIGRRPTLILSAATYTVGLLLLGVGGGLWVLLGGQVLLGAGRAFASGTDTAFLYQSLAAVNRAREMEHHTFVAWRFGFAALGISAIIGGVMALWIPALPFFASALALACATILAVSFCEPPATGATPRGEWQRMLHLFEHFRQPVLVWIFVLAVLMYGFSHLPFVFGQPFISAILDGFGDAGDAPWISGTVTALMMGLSLLVSLTAPRLRKSFGLLSVLLLAFAIQVGLAAGLAVSGSVVAISLLLLRMVPDSLSTPFILAHLQPLLGDDTRASFLSIKSFVGRLLFAGSLSLAAISTTDVDAMPLSDVQSVLWIYATGGFVLLMILAMTALRVRKHVKEQPTQS